MSCPLGRNATEPCRRKSAGITRDTCTTCIEELAERSSLIQYGGMGLDRAQSDALAVEQARASLPGQRSLVG
jgi:hypothetical protein